MAFCASCGKALSAGAQFCGGCGAAAVALEAVPAANGAPRAAMAQATQGKPGGWLIAAGYVFALLGGLLGIFFGGYLWRSKEKLPDGGKTPRFNASARRHGLIIFILSIVMIVIFKNMK